MKGKSMVRYEISLDEPDPDKGAHAYLFKPLNV